MTLKKLFRKPKNWRNFIENILSIMLFFVALYLIVTPFLPEILLWWSKTTDKTHGFVYASNHPLAPKEESNTNSNNQLSNETPVKPIPKENRVVLPTIEADVLITEGNDARALHDGAWHRPKTSSPDLPGNTVLAAHRFTYNANFHSYFYNLDKIKAGDPIIVYWQGKEYDYEVESTKEVAATAIEVEAPTPDTRLTLYTCTPLLTAKDRLVVIAKPV